ncbi:MAG: winged helix-turn-helix domain-containing protein [Oscillospiraceae bacterium]|jgi:DNA-binding response OmpR family regulator
MEKKDRILIIEDDADISMIEETYLQSAGFETDVRKDGENILGYMEKNPCSLVLLDLMLPGKNGYEICEEIRSRYDLPILMVTARNESVDKVRGFNRGADDYISKPFDPMELTARVRANLRQYHRLRESSPDSQAGSAPEICVGGLRIQPDSWRVFKGDSEIRLANREFELLKFLAQNPNIVFSREQLMERIWGYDYIGDTSTVMVHINRLREKIEDNPKNPRILETIWGAGYRLNSDPQE